MIVLAKLGTIYLVCPDDVAYVEANVVRNKKAKCVFVDIKTQACYITNYHEQLKFSPFTLVVVEDEERQKLLQHIISDKFHYPEELETLLKQIKDESQSK